LGQHARDDETSRLIPWRPTLGDVCDANKAILDAYEHREYYRLRDRGFLEKALVDAFGEHLEAGDARGAIRAAAKLAHLIARAQAFQDGNHRTALVVAQTYLANNDLGALSALGYDDVVLAEHIAGTGIKSLPVSYGPEDTAALLLERFEALHGD
jgi:prophage maintenance system killer protein